MPLVQPEHRHFLRARASEIDMADKPGDTNLDGTVNFVDLARLAEDWLR